MPSLVTSQFSALLNAVLKADSRYLPIPPSDQTRLLTLIPRDDFMYLVIDDGINTEQVKVVNECGTLLMYRAIDEGEAFTFPVGSCVSMVMTAEIVKWLICNYDCCATDCPCTPVIGESMFNPPATVSQHWEGGFTFSGDQPMLIGLSQDSQQQGWMSVTVGPNYLAIKGTPTGAGSFRLTAVASNCNGESQDAMTMTVTVSA